jgi:pSer/pThr/pTyr-binding forkhead associated (FHA) protein
MTMSIMQQGLSLVKECPNCHTSVADKDAICSKCGSLLFSNSQKTQALANTDFEDSVVNLGTSFIGRRTNLVIQVREYSKTFVLDAHDIQEVIIGRYDPDTGESPPIDLHDCDGVNKGVSRRHAALIKDNNKLQLVDKGSPNGTFLNGQRMVANEPRFLRDGDEVRLGHLVLVVSFEEVNPLHIGNI